jgi:hypothetical protein
MFKSILKHAAIVALAGILTYALQVVGSFDLGEWAPIVILILSTAIHALDQLLNPPAAVAPAAVTQ